MAITIHLTDDQADGLMEIIHLAHQARDAHKETCRLEFDYDPADRQAIENRWNAAQAVIGAITHQATPGNMPLVDTLANFLNLARDWVNGDIWAGAQCVEAEAAAELYRALGQDNAASQLLAAHATGDDDETDQHHAQYLHYQKEGGITL